jgi:hypothetical protein
MLHRRLDDGETRRDSSARSLPGITVNPTERKALDAFCLELSTDEEIVEALSRRKRTGSAGNGGNTLATWCSWMAVSMRGLRSGDHADV